MLWLCLQFPWLPLEIFSRARRPDLTIPEAVATGRGARQVVLACNSAAAETGIQPGMKTASAHALAGDLQMHVRDPEAEHRALEGLAAWAAQFTSRVSLEPPNALLLEIGGSLRLFGGLDALLRRIRCATADLGYQAWPGTAPTSLAAWVLACSGIRQPVTRPDALESVLRLLPPEALGVEETAVAALRGLGVRNLGELLRLPRDGLARRFGPELPGRLDRLLGHRADPRVVFTPPERFERELTLPAATAEREALLFPARRLLQELGGYLLARQVGARQLHWHFAHERRPATRLTLGLAVANRDPQHMLTLLRERLVWAEVQHPVVEIALEVSEAEPLRPHNLPLYDEAGTPTDDTTRFIEVLRARLGKEAVRGLQYRPDHRPEKAWSPSDPGVRGPTSPALTRPLWLLNRPRALASPGGTPCLDTPLILESGPERIESGWWDGSDVARDYYVARDGSYAWFWIFRERRDARRWYLHGLFA